MRGFGPSQTCGQNGATCIPEVPVDDGDGTPLPSELNRLRKSAREDYFQKFHTEFAESLGKEGHGRVPLTAVNTRDLHSRHQQHQEGRREKLVNNLIVETQTADAESTRLTKRSASGDTTGAGRTMRSEFALATITPQSAGISVGSAMPSATPPQTALSGMPKPSRRVHWNRRRPTRRRSRWWGPAARRGPASPARGVMFGVTRGVTWALRRHCRPRRPCW